MLPSDDPGLATSAVNDLIRGALVTILRPLPIGAGVTLSTSANFVLPLLVAVPGVPYLVFPWPRTDGLDNRGLPRLPVPLRTPERRTVPDGGGTISKRVGGISRICAKTAEGIIG
jgi:hypothetical protein